MMQADCRLQNPAEHPTWWHLFGQRCERAHARAMHSEAQCRRMAVWAGSADISLGGWNGVENDCELPPEAHFLLLLASISMHGSTACEEVPGLSAWRACRDTVASPMTEHSSPASPSMPLSGTATPAA